TVAPELRIKVLAAFPRLGSDEIPRKPPPSVTSPVKELLLVRLKPLVLEGDVTSNGVVSPAGELTTPLSVMREFCAVFDRALLTPSRMGTFVVRPLLSGSA